MAVGNNIVTAAESALGDADLLAQITEGMKRTESIEVRRAVRVPKKHAITRWEVEHDLDTQLWCGPAAVSAIAGVPTSIIREIIREYREDESARVEGTFDPEMVYAFDQLGFEMRLVYFCYAPLYKQAPTFARWLREMPREPHVAYLIGQRGHGREPGHWCLVAGDWYLCSYSKSVWMPLDKAPRRRARIESAYAIWKR